MAQKYLVRIKNEPLIRARLELIGPRVREYIAGKMEAEPARLTMRQIDEYIYAIGLRHVALEAKTQIFKDRREGLANMAEIGKSALVEELKRAGFDGVAREVEADESIDSIKVEQRAPVN